MEMWSSSCKHADRSRNVAVLQTRSATEGSETLASAYDVTVSILANDGRLHQQQQRQQRQGAKRCTGRVGLLSHDPNYCKAEQEAKMRSLIFWNCQVKIGSGWDLLRSQKKKFVSCKYFACCRLNVTISHRTHQQDLVFTAHTRFMAFLEWNRLSEIQEVHSKTGNALKNAFYCRVVYRGACLLGVHQRLDLVKMFW